jgi:hypothetical protein
VARERARISCRRSIKELRLTPRCPSLALSLLWAAPCCALADGRCVKQTQPRFAGAQQAAEMADTQGNEHIEIVVRNQQREEIKFKIKKTTKLGKVRAVCRRRRCCCRRRRSRRRRGDLQRGQV